MPATRTRRSSTTSDHSIPKGPSRGRYVKVNYLALGTVVEFSGLTQKQLAKKAKLTQPAISYLVSGTRETCRPETAAKLSEALGLKGKRQAQVFQLVLAGEA